MAGWRTEAVDWGSGGPVRGVARGTIQETATLLLPRKELWPSSPMTQPGTAIRCSSTRVTPCSRREEAAMDNPIPPFAVQAGEGIAPGDTHR